MAPKAIFSWNFRCPKKLVDNSLYFNLAKTSLLESNKDSNIDQSDANSTYKKELMEIDEGWNKSTKIIAKSDIGCR